MTTRESKIIEITKAIQAAVPSLNRVTSFNPKLGIPDHIYPDPTMSIGIREILIFLNTKANHIQWYTLRPDGHFIHNLCDGSRSISKLAQYNLHKDRIEDQDNEVIDFLFTFTQS